MWIEKTPEIGDTIRHTWPAWYEELALQRTVIGVVKKRHDGWWIVDVGDKYLYIATGASLEVYQP